MTIKNIIEDGLGTGKTAQVTPANAVLVQLTPDTSIGISEEALTSIRLQREFFLNSSNSELMNVDGSVTPVDFEITAELGFTKWITGFRIIMEDTNLEMDTADFRRFGSATTAGSPLTNGVQIFSFQSGEITNIANDPIRFSGDFFRYSDDYLNFKNAISAQEDYLLFRFNLDKPIVLPDGSSDKIVIRINDDLTPLVTMYAIARGYKEASS